MRRLSLAGVAALAACHDSTVSPSGPDRPLAAHLDSLSAQATSASQLNRAAALDLALRAIADGSLPGTLQITTSLTSAPASFTAVAWSEAHVILKNGVDSVADSLMVFVAWRGLTADSMLVIRAGHPGLAPNVQAELETLGLTGALSGDSLASAALVSGNVVTLADSGTVNGLYGILGSLCSYITVSSIGNDSGSGSACQLALLDVAFALRFSPSTLWGLNAGASPGVVIVH